MGSDSYFSSPNEQRATRPGRFVRVAELPELNVAAGLVLQPLLGSGLMVSFARYEPGAEAPLHAHEEEHYEYSHRARHTCPREHSFDVALCNEQDNVSQ